MKQSDSSLFPALFMLLGCGLLIFGIALIYRPAAVILAGALLTAFGFFGRRTAF